MSGSTATFANTTSVGNYRRIGNICWINGEVYNAGAATSSSGSIYITGLPFTGANKGYSAMSFSVSQYIDTDGANVFATHYGSNTKIDFKYIADDTIGTSATANLLDNGDSYLGFSGWYPVL